MKRSVATSTKPGTVLHGNYRTGLASAVRSIACSVATTFPSVKYYRGLNFYICSLIILLFFKCSSFISSSLSVFSSSHVAELSVAPSVVVKDTPLHSKSDL